MLRLVAKLALCVGIAVAVLALILLVIAPMIGDPGARSPNMGAWIGAIGGASAGAFGAYRASRKRGEGP